VADFVAAQNVARRLIADNGRSLTFVQLSTTPTNTSQPWDGNASAQADSVTIDGTFVQPSSSFLLGITTAQSDLFQNSSAIIIVPHPPTGENLATFDRVIDGSTTWKIVTVETLQPGDLPILYFVGVAR
jgi:hypothetical protein